ncbi:MAG TPA: hypothetical protein VK781_01325 [Solirubrobacteraceae bacterium]|jgi:hypothetical protein|nr:hypothetical protein [Solirubrobacteraceae bacterium]
MHEENDQRIRHHVQLPGGRQIEVVYLDSSSSHGRPNSAPAASAAVGGGHNGAPGPSAAVAGGHSDAPAGTAGGPSTTPDEALHICPGCAGELVHPLDWFEESPGRWRILMLCPDCDLQREGVFGQALVERFDDELDRATSSLLSDLKQITQANMAEEIERFSLALQLDLIGPSDF